MALGVPYFQLMDHTQAFVRKSVIRTDTSSPALNSTKRSGSMLIIPVILNNGSSTNTPHFLELLITPVTVPTNET